MAESLRIDVDPTPRTKTPPRIFAHPMEGKYSRARRKQEEEGAVHLERALAQHGWNYYWEGDKLVMVEVEDEDSNSGKGRGAVEDDGPDEEEIQTAVSDAKTSEDAGELHDAATVLREASTARSEEGQRRLLRLGAVQAALKLLKTSDVALQEDAAIALYNMCRHSFMQDRVSDSGGLIALTAALKAVLLPSTKANIAATLALLTRTETNSVMLVTSGVLPALLDMLKTATQKARPLADPEALTPRRANFHSPTLASAGDTSVRDACVALMRLAKFKPIRVALLRHGAIPRFADVANVAEYTGADKEVAALFALLTRVEGAAEKVCLEDEGRAALALVDLATSQNPSAQALAIGALGQVALNKPDCCAALRALEVPEKLLSEDTFLWFQDDLKEKVQKIAEYVKQT